MSLGLSISLMFVYIFMSCLYVHFWFGLKQGVIVQPWPAWSSLCIPGWAQLNSERSAGLCLQVLGPRGEPPLGPPGPAVPAFLIMKDFSCTFFEHLPPHASYPPPPFISTLVSHSPLCPPEVFTFTVINTYMTLYIWKSRTHTVFIF